MPKVSLFSNKRQGSADEKKGLQATEHSEILLSVVSEEYFQHYRGLVEQAVVYLNNEIHSLIQRYHIEQNICMNFLEEPDLFQALVDRLSRAVFGIKQRVEKPKNMGQMLDSILITIVENYQRNILRAIERTFKHFAELAQHFLNKNPNNIMLRRITPVGSDPHQGGQEVLLLEFSDQSKQNEIIGCVIYKPSSLEADARICGDTDRLRKIRGDFQGRSLVELLNIGIADQKLTTYLIYPCLSDSEAVFNLDLTKKSSVTKRAELTDDEDTNTLSKKPSFVDAYGFIEYLSYEPWPELDVDQLIANIYNRLNPNDYYNDAAIMRCVQAQLRQERIFSSREIKDVDTVAKYVEIHFYFRLTEIYKKRRSQGLGSDFIVETEQQIINFSQQAGRLIAIAYLAHMSDIHVENMIIHGLQPFFIDQEVSFQTTVNQIQDTGCFDKRDGAMQSDTYSVSRHLFQGQEDKMIELVLPKIEKNRLFRAHRLCRFIDGKLQPCKPYQDEFRAGFREIIEYIRANPAQITHWLESDAVKVMWVRVLPFNTHSLRETVRGIGHSNLDNEMFDLLEYDEIRSWCQDIASLLRDQIQVVETQQFKQVTSEITPLLEVKSEAPIKERVVVYKQPRFAAIARSVIELDIKAISIPVFYMQVNGLVLYNSQGLPITINYDRARIVAKELRLAETLQYLESCQKSQNYRFVTGSQHIQRFINSLAESDIINTLLAELDKSIANFPNSSATRQCPRCTML